MSLLKPLILNLFFHKPASPSPVSGSEDVFEIKEIFEAKHFKDKLYYLIDWKGFGPEEKSC